MTGMTRDDWDDQEMTGITWDDQALLEKLRMTEMTRNDQESLG